MFNIKTVAPKVIVSLKYATTDNFTGEVITGYQGLEPLLEEEAALALGKASDIAERKGLKIVLFDAYRPREAVDHFVRWAKKEKREDLFDQGYVSLDSIHCLGQAVDVSLEGLDMGCPFDTFGPIAHVETNLISKEQQSNRFLLRDIMKEAGFEGIDLEWWHFNARASRR